MQPRCGLERRSVIALVAVLALAAAFAAHYFWSGRTEAVGPPDVVRAVSEAPVDGAERASTGPSGSPAGPSAGVPGGQIYVDISGKVRRPGLRRLPAGARVEDALRAAGGVRPGTDTVGLNRARVLIDGEQVVVGGPVPSGGTGGGGVAVTGPGAASARTPTATGGVPGAGGAAGTPVALSTATVEQLDALPGVGPVLAQHIVDYRTQHGGFRSVDELRQVNGIGDRRFADLRTLVSP
ncbi:helix-hairpin-helix domain-containing protein [Streptomyces sp. NA04227]|nr:helix-hairpin-helix domain-containing protein [Streptomyces sp. NA04227]